MYRTTRLELEQARDSRQEGEGLCGGAVDELLVGLRSEDQQDKGRQRTKLCSTVPYLSASLPFFTNDIIYIVEKHIFPPLT